MPRADTWVTCPQSAKAWRLTLRRQAADSDRYTAACPSCGQGLRLRDVAGTLTLELPRIGSPAPGHQLGQPRPKVLL